eukprot:2187215-Rhodomonas_salina.4
MSTTVIGYRTTNMLCDVRGGFLHVFARSVKGHSNVVSCACSRARAWHHPRRHQHTTHRTRGTQCAETNVHDLILRNVQSAAYGAPRCYEMSGTDVAYGTTRCFAMSGTDVAYMLPASVTGAGPSVGPRPFTRPRYSAYAATPPP